MQTSIHKANNPANTKCFSLRAQFVALGITDKALPGLMAQGLKLAQTTHKARPLRAMFNA